MDAIRDSEDAHVRDLKMKKKTNESDFVTILRYLLQRPPDP